MSDLLEQKDPSDVKDYSIEWAPVLTAESETAIATSTWAVLPTGLTIATGPTPPASSIAGTKTIVWVSGGTANTNYELTNTIVTSGATPRTHQRTVIIPCRER